jgi:hypothetical protein
VYRKRTVEETFPSLSIDDEQESGSMKARVRMTRRMSLARDARGSDQLVELGAAAAGPDPSYIRMEKVPPIRIR